MYTICVALLVNTQYVQSYINANISANDICVQRIVSLVRRFKTIRKGIVQNSR